MEQFSKPKLLSLQHTNCNYKRDAQKIYYLQIVESKKILQRDKQ